MSQVIFLVCSLSAVTRSTSKTLPPQLLQLLGTDATIKVSTSLMCAFSHSVMSESLWPMDCSPPGPSYCGFPRQEYWSGLPLPSPGALPNPGVEPRSPAWQKDSLSLSHLGSHWIYVRNNKENLCCESPPKKLWEAEIFKSPRLRCAIFFAAHWTS